MPEIYRDEKRKEFLNLKQGIMSIAEYEVKFNQLSHYASFMIAAERDGCQKFEEGLNYKIQSKITTSELENFSKLKTTTI